MTAVVIQARLASTRLPEKALLPLGGKQLLFRVMQAMKTVPCDAHILACTPDSQGIFAPLAEEAGFLIFAGPEKDVLGRFCDAARRFAIDRVLRATGDNPFLFADAAAATILESEASGADYCSFSGMPHGSGVEAVLASALLRAERETDDPFDREHVCPYLYKNPAAFLLHRPLAPKPWVAPRVRLTVDTEEDYRLARILYDRLDGMDCPSLPYGRYAGRNILAGFESCFGPRGSLDGGSAHGA
jgi:spore coat polysaccharide biosynthesis protein SpsF